MLEKEIIIKCSNIIREYPPILSITSIRNDISQNKRFDTLLDVKTETRVIQFIVKVKGILKRPLPLNLFFENISKDDFPLIMAEHINSSIAEELICKKINFVDCQGNIFMNIPGKIYIEVTGKNKKIQREKQTTILFNPKGMQLLSVLINNENLLANSLRNLQKIAGISLERAYRVMKELKENGYVVKIAKDKLVFDNKRNLIEKWLANYSERLRPKLLIGTYKISSHADIHKIAELLKGKKLGFAFGGGTGGEILTDYYRSGCMDIFIREEQSDEIIKELKLLPAKDYNVRLFKLFSKDIIFNNEQKESPLVLPLLIYAELLFMGTNREIETAKIIYNKYLKDKFE